MSGAAFARIRVYLSSAVLSLALFPTATSAQNASGHFEVYCDGVGFFLGKIDGAPVPGRLLLFLYTGFPGILTCQRVTGKMLMFIAMDVLPMENAKSSPAEKFG